MENNKTIISNIEKKKTIILKLDENQLEIKVRDNLDARNHMETFDRTMETPIKELEKELVWRRSKLKAGSFKFPASAIKTIAILNFVLSNK